MKEDASSSVFVTLGCRQLYRTATSLVPRVGPSSSVSVFVTLGCRQLLGSCHFAHPQSESVLVFVCLRLRPSTSLPVPVFVYLRFRLCPS